jgi:hypothetical protein
MIRLGESLLTTVYNCAQIKLTTPRYGGSLWEMLLSIPTGDGHDQAMGKKALHIVSAWAAEHRLVLAETSHRREIQRDLRDPEAFAATSLGRMHCHH